MRDLKSLLLKNIDIIQYSDHLNLITQNIKKNYKKKRGKRGDRWLYAHVLFPKKMASEPFFFFFFEIEIKLWLD